jgi:hypothetical protein
VCSQVNTLRQKRERRYGHMCVQRDGVVTVYANHNDSMSCMEHAMTICVYRERDEVTAYANHNDSCKMHVVYILCDLQWISVLILL